MIKKIFIIKFDEIKILENKYKENSQLTKYFLSFLNYKFDGLKIK